MADTLALACASVSDIELATVPGGQVSAPIMPAPAFREAVA